MSDQRSWCADLSPHRTVSTVYRGSHDITVVVVPQMAHMHNFAHTRAQLWDRLAGFARPVPLPHERGA